MRFVNYSFLFLLLIRLQPMFFRFGDVKYHHVSPPPLPVHQDDADNEEGNVDSEEIGRGNAVRDHL